MPFTFAHPAAAAPLLRPLGRYGSLSALVIGSIAPDLAFIVPIGLAREHTHGLGALFLFCLPAGALAYLLFHAVLKAPLVSLLPHAVAGRLVEGRSTASWIAVLVSLLCGAATHLLWDAFTHPGTPIVNALPLLQQELGNVGGYRLYAFKLAQHAGSVVGLGLLALGAANWLRRTPVTLPRQRGVLSNAQRIGALAALAGLPFLAGVYAGWRRCPVITNMLDLQEFATGFVFTALPVGALVLTTYSVLWQLKIASSRSGRR